MDKSNNTESKNVQTLKFGKRTYFFDIKVATNGNEYLKITESRFVKEGEPNKRMSFILFGNEVAQFTDTLSKIKLKTVTKKDQK